VEGGTIPKRGPKEGSRGLGREEQKCVTEGAAKGLGLQTE